VNSTVWSASWSPTEFTIYDSNKNVLSIADNCDSHRHCLLHLMMLEIFLIVSWPWCLICTNGQRAQSVCGYNRLWEKVSPPTEITLSWLSLQTELTEVEDKLWRWLIENVKSHCQFAVMSLTFVYFECVTTSICIELFINWECLVQLHGASKKSRNPCRRLVYELSIVLT